MKYHCGLLDERPENSRTLNWIKCPSWGHQPPEIEHERRVWLAMPGFTVSYHRHTLGQGRVMILNHIGGFEEYKDEVIENWLSATREDCVKLARLRPGLGAVPLISQLRAAQDLKTMRLTDVANDYGVHLSTASKWSKGKLSFTGTLPSGFEWLVATS